jgi:hypothetical protein
MRFSGCPIQIYSYLKVLSMGIASCSGVIFIGNHASGTCIRAIAQPEAVLYNSGRLGLGYYMLIRNSSTLDDPNSNK